MRQLLSLVLVFSLITPATACLWDYDTLQMERAAFPGTLELIVGKFLRHTDAFYEWRVEDRSSKIAADKAGKLSLTDKELARAYDDWAVALDKLGRHDEAIDVINEKAERLPDVGQYKTLANRGTFLIHAGQLEEGVAEIRKALEINPDAHFGREEYQIFLVEYVMENWDESGEISLPLEGSFAFWLQRRQGLDLNDDGEQAIEAEIKRATKGVMGMMRFGDYESPILLEALGDLLATSGGDVQAQRLAARAYLRAAMEVDDPAARDAYREMARIALVSQMAGDGKGYEPLSLAELEEQLARELKEANTWFETTVAYDEELWVVTPTADPTPDERYWRKYGEQVIEVGHVRLPPAHFLNAGLRWQYQVAMAATAVLTLALVVGLLIWRGRRPTGYN